MITVKPTIPAVIDQFREYHDSWPAWGSLHIVLDDLNAEHDHVKWCYLYAVDNGDAAGARLAAILLAMSPTQRRKLADVA